MLLLLLVLMLQPAQLNARCTIPGKFKLSVYPKINSIKVEWDTTYTVKNLYFRPRSRKQWKGQTAELMEAVLDIGRGYQEMFVASDKGGACSTPIGFIQADGMNATFAVRGEGETTVIVDVTTPEQQKGIQCSFDGGKKYPGTAPLSDSNGELEGRCTMTVPGPGVYNVWVRWANKAWPTYAGKAVVGNLGQLMELEQELEDEAKKADALEAKIEKLTSDSERLNKAIGVAAKVLANAGMRVNEHLRSVGSSGLISGRDSNSGVKAFQRGTHMGGSLHNHNNHVRTLGMGEYQAVLNGVQFQTRHNDYKFRQPDPNMDPSVASATFPPVSMEVEHPPVPPSVLQKATVGEQVSEMREYFRAFKDQNVAHRDYRPYFRPVLCILEGTWTESQANVTEPFESDRHFIDADSWEELSMKSRLSVNSGKKDPKGNIPYLPSAIREVIKDSDGAFVPVTAQWFYRVVCQPLEGDVSTARFRVKDELSLQMSHGGPHLTKEELSRRREATFDLRPELEGKVDLKSPWPESETYHRTYADQLMEQIPGFDGAKQFLKSDVDGEVEYHPEKTSDPLNTAFYSRSYSFKEKDAMGKRSQKRGFHDNFWAAQTTNKRVSPQRVCKTAKSQNGERPEECKKQMTAEGCSRVKFTELDPLISGRCKVVSGTCVYQECTVQRWTYAIPLEIVYTTPLTEWNPYNIAMMSEAEQKEGGKDGSKQSPYKGASATGFLRTPSEFFGEAIDARAEDTAPVEERWVLGDGSSHSVKASGYQVLYNIEGVGAVRQRYPIFQFREFDTTPYKEVKALEELFVNADDPAIQTLIKEIAEHTSLNGVELVLTRGSHDHFLQVGGNDYDELKKGIKNTIILTSSERNAHEHVVQVKYDASKVGAEWSIDWCTMGSQDGCEHLAMGTCENGCCRGKCLDNHLEVE